jgi:hypothetical protein
VLRADRPQRRQAFGGRRHREPLAVKDAHDPPAPLRLVDDDEDLVSIRIHSRTPDRAAATAAFGFAISAIFPSFPSIIASI